MHLQYTAKAIEFAVDFDDRFLGGHHISGGQSWTVDTDDACTTGTDAAKSDPIGDEEVTWMRRRVSGATISFCYRINS